MDLSVRRDRKNIILICLTFVIFMTVIYLIHIPMEPVSDDEANLALGISFQNVLSFVIDRFYHIGKFITDGTAFFLYLIPFKLWKLIDTLIYAGILYLLWDMFTDRSLKMLIASACAVTMFPVFFYMYSAGFIMTSTNYVYAAAALLLGYRPLMHALEERHTSVPTYILSIVGLIYASNQDQSALIAIGGFLMTGIVFLWKYKRTNNSQSKKMIRLCTICFVLSILLYAFTFFTPGHLERMSDNSEAVRFLPQYLHWSPLKKIYQGMSSTFAHIFFQKPVLFSCFTVLILITTCIHNKKRAVFPLMLFLLLQICSALQGSAAFGHDTFISLYDYSFGMADLLPLQVTPIPFIVSIIIFILMIISVLCLYETDPRLSVTLFILNTLGFGSRFMIGLSPTIYASSYRTFTFQMFCFMICDLLMLGTILDKTCNKEDKL